MAYSKSTFISWTYAIELRTQTEILDHFTSKSGAKTTRRMQGSLGNSQTLRQVLASEIMHLAESWEHKIHICGEMAKWALHRIGMIPGLIREFVQ